MQSRDHCSISNRTRTIRSPHPRRAGSHPSRDSLLLGPATPSVWGVATLPSAAHRAPLRLPVPLARSCRPVGPSAATRDPCLHLSPLHLGLKPESAHPEV